ncbi:hypothetical protein CVT25_001530 [Psilocybe cyanescens]|uniref:Rho-GAP domain-containing protein n=1 Tax=Psilocybe cyanescens TaxID=93625 RepID=A0A409VUP9_PSICY|nr:hypothetical protein CVT25_001530 [Psilocybe cyanescens]
MAVLNQVQNLLRSTDQVKVVLDATLVTTSESAQDAQSRRVLAVISHKDDWNLTEEGCLFVCKYKTNLSGQPNSEELDIQRVFPIYGEFSIVISQMRRGMSQTDTPQAIGTSRSKSVLEQPRAVITLSVTPAEGLPNDAHPPTFFTYDVQGLRSVVTECKQLKEVSDVEANAIINLASSTTYFNWLRPYFTKRTTVASLTTTLQDLRQTIRPLIDRLSPACAGLMGDDHTDAQVIRDEWIRAKSRWEARKQHGGRKLTLRLGTFNVNGKMPSQDLSAWIQGNSSTKTRPDKFEVDVTGGGGIAPSLPPLKTVSPISMGDAGMNPFNWVSGNATTSQPNLTSTSTSTSIDSDGNDVPIPASLPVDPSDPDPDLFVLGFQELDLSTEALIYSTGTMREDAWCNAVFASLGEKGEKYEKLTSKQLVGMLIVVIVKKTLTSCFGGVRTAMSGAGILGIMGNKGGTAVRLSFTPPASVDSRDSESTATEDTMKLTPGASPSPGASSVTSPGPTTLTFVNAHLAAFDEMAEKRNSDFMDLSRKLTFEGSSVSGQGEEGENGADDPLYAGMDPNTGEGGTGRSILSVYESDVLFWLVRPVLPFIRLASKNGFLNLFCLSVLTNFYMGFIYGLTYRELILCASPLDLNYRVDLPDTHMRNTLRDDEWNGKEKFEALLRFDQLKKAMRDKKAFEGFIEGPIEHMPTYRFSPGLMMDKLGYDLKRKPAWTDRILYMHSSACRVEQLSYTGHPEIVMSDHRPVSADFVVDMDFYDVETLQLNARGLFDQVHDLDGESAHQRGGLKVDNTYVDFGKVSYDTQVQRKITVRNTSKYACAFRFVPVQLDTPIHPEWLHIHPMLGVLLPDEATEITLTAHVDNEIASILNQKPTDLSGTLILHTVLGQDHFISVSGEYLENVFEEYTCFANKLSRLTRLRGPIRSMKSPNDLLPENNSINAPREIMRLVNWMMTSTPTSEIFLLPGDPEIVKTIRECLDTGDEFPYAPDTLDAAVPLAFATALLSFLDSLSDSIVPAALHQRCLEMSDRDEAFELLDALPPTSVNVWISITAFLHFICQGSSKNENYAEEIATVFANTLLRDDPSSLALSISTNGKRKFLLYFIS